VGVEAVRDHVAGAYQIHDLGRFGRSEADVRHQRQLEFVAELARGPEEVQAVAAVHIGADVDLNAQEDVAIGRGRFPGAPHFAPDVLDHVDIRVAQVPAKTDLREMFFMRLSLETRDGMLNPQTVADSSPAGAK